MNLWKKPKRLNPIELLNLFQQIKFANHLKKLIKGIKVDYRSKAQRKVKVVPNQRNTKLKNQNNFKRVTLQKYLLLISPPRKSKNKKYQSQKGKPFNYQFFPKKIQFGVRWICKQCWSMRQVTITKYSFLAKV